VSIRRRRFLQLAAGTAALPAIFRIAAAESYPSRPITMIVPFPPGGLADVIARVLIDGMRALLGQPVIIENVGGATGSIGTGRVARAAPDGYTIALGIWNTHVANGAMYALSYDVVKDFEPIVLLADAPLLLVVKKAVPANDLKEFNAWLKANPDQVSMSTVGAGSPGHLLGLLLQKEIGARFGQIPYRGANPAMQDVVAGQIDAMFSNPATALAHVRAGSIKALAVTAKHRLAVAPEIPTMDEAGLPGFYFSLWAGLFAPRDTPKPIIASLNAAALNALSDAGTRRALVDQGLEIPSRERQTPEALAEYQKAEIEKWWPIIKAANIKGE
jgi:tripartite-type tricarboxylate transporter receptor subunit TctC